MALAKFSLREVRNRPARAILTLLSVVIGVAMIVSVNVATSTTRVAQQAIFNSISGTSTLEVVSQAGAAFDGAVLKTIAAVPGVEQAVPVIRQPSIISYGKRKKVTVFALGIDPQRDAAVRQLEVKAGRTLKPDDEGLLVDEGLAKELSLATGQKVKLWTREGRIDFDIVGLVTSQGDGAAQSMIYLSLPAAQEYMRRAGQIDCVQIVPREGTSLDALQPAVAKVLPPGLVMLRTADRRSQAEETLLSTEMGVLLGSLFSWVVALLIVLNTFQMNVVERRRQLAALRAIGATRRQIIWLVCREGVVLGLLGTVLGIAFGLGGAHLLSMAIAKMLEMPLPAMQVEWPPLVLALALGPAIAALGAFLPAWKAGQLTPLEGMRAVQQTDLEPPPWSLALTGLAIVIAAAAVLGACIAGGFSMLVAVLSAIVLLMGLILLLPVSLLPLATAAAASLAWLCGVEGRLARGQITRRRGRTTLTVGVLFLAISICVAMANTITGAVNDVRRWGRIASQGDFFVRAMMPDMNTGLSSDLPPQVGTQIESLAGIAAIQTVRFARMDAGDQSVIVLAGNFGEQGDDRFKFDLVSGDPQEIQAALKRGEVLIGTVLALRGKQKLGDMIPLEMLDGPDKVRVAGTVNDYIGGGLTMYMDRDVARKKLGIEGVDAYVIWAEPGKQAQLEQALRALTEEHGLLLQKRDEVLGMIDSRINGLVACQWFLLFVVFIAAAFGVVNTLTMNVIEQTRELGLLRIVAMTRPQVRKMILAQAAIMALIALVPGALAGLGVAYLLNRSMEPISGHPIVFVLHYSVIIGCCAMAFAIVLIAAWFPATRATRLKLAEAIQYQ